MKSCFTGWLLVFLLTFGTHVCGREIQDAPTLASQILLPGLLKSDWKSSSFSSDGRALLVVDESRSFVFDVVEGRELRQVSLAGSETLLWSRPVPRTYNWIVVTSSGRLLQLDGKTGKWTRILDLNSITFGRNYKPKTVSFEFISDVEIALSAITRSESKRGRVSEASDKQILLIISIAGKKILATKAVSSGRYSLFLDSEIAVNASTRSIALYSRSVSTLVTWNVEGTRSTGLALKETCVYDRDTEIVIAHGLASAFLIVNKEGKAFYLDANKGASSTCTAKLPADPAKSRCIFDLKIASIAGRPDDASDLIIVDKNFDVKRISFFPAECAQHITQLGNVKVASMVAPIYTKQDAVASSSTAPSESFSASSLDNIPILIANGNLLRLVGNGAAPESIQLLVGKPTGAFEIEAGHGFLIASRLMAPLRAFDFEGMRLRTINYDFRRFLDETFFYNKPFAIAKKSGWVGVIERSGLVAFHEATALVDTASMPPPQMLDVAKPNALCLSDDGKRMWILAEESRLVLFENQGNGKFSRTTQVNLSKLGDPFKLACAGTAQTVVVSDSLTDSVNVVELHAGQAVLVQELKIANSSSEIVRPSLSEDGTLLAIGSHLFFRTGPERKFSLVTTLPRTQRLIFDGSGEKILATGERSGLYSVVRRNGRVQLKRTAVALPVALDGAFLGDGYLMLIRGTGEAQIFSTMGERLGSVTFGDDRQWMFFDDVGRFDTDDIEGRASGAWVMADSPMQALDPEIYMRDYLEPKLMPRLMHCKREEDADPNACSSIFAPIRPVSSLNRSRPVVTITKIEPDNEQGRTVSVTVRVSGGSRANTPDSGGAFDLHLRQNDQVVGRRPVLQAPDQPVVTAIDLNRWRESHRILDGVGSIDLKISGIRLAGSENADNVSFSAYAFNRDRVKGRTHQYSYVTAPTPGPVARRAFVIAVGVSAYEDSTIDLKYAAQDARKFIENVVPALKSTGRFKEVIPLLLTSEWTVDAEGGSESKNRRLTAMDAKKHHIRELIETVSNGSSTPQSEAIERAGVITQAGPDDTVLIFFSGHGLSSAGEFFLVPYDSGMKSSDSKAAPVLQHNKLVSSSELSFWMKDLVADDIVLIVDACHSSASIETPDFKPGPMGSRGLGQLAYDKGMRVLASTRPNDLSWESETTGQGLLTFSLVEEGLRQRKADRLPTDGKITVGEWLQFGVDRVPELYAQTAAGRTKGEAKLVTFDGGDRSPREVSVDGARVQAGNQQPTIFSFRRRPDSILETKSQR